jgi:hypothetical protein
MSYLAKSTHVHIIGIRGDGRKQYLVKPETTKNARGETVLWPLWSDFPKDSKPLDFEFAKIFQRRMRQEHGAKIHLTLTAGGDFVEFREPEDAADYTKRVPMTYKGLIATPGFHAQTQTPVWYVKLRDPARGDLESIRGDSVEEAVDRVFERQLQHFAEKAPEAIQPPAVPQDDAPVGPRFRPGDIDYRAPKRR